MNDSGKNSHNEVVRQVLKRSAFSGLTQKQTRFVQAKVCGMSSAQAARHAGYAESIARKPAKIMGRPAVRRALAELLEAAGISDPLLALRIREGLDATEMKFVTSKAGNCEPIVLVDWSTRRSYLVMALKLKGLLQPRQSERGATLEDILEKASSQPYGRE